MKALRRNPVSQVLVLLLVMPSLVWLPQASWSNPGGGSVIMGDAQILDPSGKTLTIEQFSDRAIIEWEDFSIAKGELTQFMQPGSGAAILNRVTGGSPSAINGALQGNGSVWLINQNGVVIGPSGAVDVFGFLASTLDVSNSAFMAGGDMNFNGAGLGDTVNFGTINAAGGDVFLVGRSVVNEGVIGAVDGTVGLAAGNNVLLKSSGSERLFISAGEGSVTNTGEITSAMAELKAHGNVGALAVNNAGAIRVSGVQTNGGKVVLSANQGNISNTGEINARNGDGSGGGIEIRSGMGEIQIGGILDASGNGLGGTVNIVGRNVNVLPATTVNASGDTGGSIQMSADPDGRIDVREGSQVVANGRSGGGGMVDLRAGDIVIYGNSTLGADGESEGGVLNIIGSGLVSMEGNASAVGRAGNGGRVAISGENVLISETGNVQANGKLSGGVVGVSAQEDLLVAGSVAAVADGGTGGTIGMSATNVIVAATGSVNASGSNGGGNVQVNATDQATVMGSVSATGGDGAGGNISFTATDLLVGPTGLIDAGGASGGTVSLDATDTTTVNGQVQAVGSDGAGGTVSILGDEVTLGATAIVDAGGDTGGGTVYIGGGFQGQGQFRNSSKTTIANGSVIRANAGSSGKGGRVSIWSDGETDFQGTISATGIGSDRGGVVEVSGLTDLNFSGLVDTGGGLLLLDPVDVVVGSAGLSEGNIATALATNNVLIHTAQIPGGTSTPGVGNLQIQQNFNLVYNSDHDLSFFAHKNISVSDGGSDGSDPGNLSQAGTGTNAGGFGVSIVNEGEGNISLVAGWDGNGLTFIGGTDPTAIGGSEQSASSATLNSVDHVSIEAGTWGEGGDILVNPNSNGTIEIGSARGETNLYGDDIFVTAGGGANRHIQIGYNVRHLLAEGANNPTYELAGDVQTNPDAIDGDVRLMAKGSILLDNDNGNHRSQIHIGHGGDRDGRNILGAQNPGAVGFNATDTIYGGLSGDVLVEADGLFLASSGEHESFIQIGHGGFDIDGNMGATTDTIRVQGSSVIFDQTGARYQDAFIQVGNGGRTVRGSHNAETIEVLATDGSVVALGSNNAQTWGSDANNPSPMRRHYFQIGNGGRDSSPVRVDDTLGHSGNIRVDATQDVQIYAGVGDENYAMVGHGGAFTGGNFTGNITVNSQTGKIILSHQEQPTQNVLLGAPQGELGRKSFVQVGHGGAMDGNNPRDFMGDMTGNIEVTAGDGTILLTGGDSFNNTGQDYGRIGHGGWGGGNTSSNGNFTGKIDVLAGFDIIVEAGDAQAGAAVIGHGGGGIDSSGASPNTGLTIGRADDLENSAITVRSSLGNISILGSENLRTNSGGTGYVAQRFAMVGHGGIAVDGSSYGNINVEATNGFIEVSAGGQTEDFAKIGHGGVRLSDGGPNSTTYTHAGNITVDAALDITVEGGIDVTPGATDPDSSFRTNFAQIGHGGDGTDTDGSNRALVLSGDISINQNIEGTGIQVLGGTGASDNFAAIGHVTNEVHRNGGITLAHDGNIALSTSGDIEVIGGSGTDHFAVVGNGGNFLRSVATMSGTIDAFAGGDVRVQAGSSPGGKNSFAQIGHFGQGPVIDVTTPVGSDITVGAGQDIYVLGNVGDGGHAMIGNGANAVGDFFADGIPVVNLAGNVDVAAARNIFVTGGSEQVGASLVGPGLIQSIYSGNTLTPAAGNLIQSGLVSYVVAGEVASNTGPWAVIGDNEAIVYEGQFYDADGIFGFAEAIDDQARVYVNGTQVLSNGTWNVPSSSIVPGDTTSVQFDDSAHGNDDWYDIRVVFANGGGGAGPASQNNDNGGAGWANDYGFGIVDPQPVTLLYAANFNTAGQGFTHTDGSLDGTAPGTFDGTNWQIRYFADPDSDTTVNEFATANNVLVIQDWGGEAVFDSPNFDVTGIDQVFVTAVGDTTGAGANEAGEFLRYEYSLDGIGLIALPGGTFSFDNGNGGASPDVIGVAIDTSGTNVFSLGLTTNVNGQDTGWDISGFQVTTAGGDPAVYLTSLPNPLDGHIYSPSSTFANVASFNDGTADYTSRFRVTATTPGVDTAATSSANGSFAQIGNGGAGMASTGSIVGGDISVRAGGNIELLNGNGEDAYSKIGNGDHLFDNPPAGITGDRAGNISVASGGNLKVEGGMIGHVPDPAVDLQALSAGSTFVAAGRNGTGSIEAIADAAGNPSMFTSGIGGQLRLYMRDRSPGGATPGAVNDNLIASGTILNGATYTAPGATPTLRADERVAVEFGFGTDARGLPTGEFTPEGAYTGPYKVYYSGVAVGPVASAGGGGGGGDPAPALPRKVAVIPPVAPIFQPQTTPVPSIFSVLVTFDGTPLVFTGNSIGDLRQSIANNLTSNGVERFDGKDALDDQIGEALNELFEPGTDEDGRTGSADYDSSSVGSTGSQLTTASVSGSDEVFEPLEVALQAQRNNGRVTVSLSLFNPPQESDQELRRAAAPNSPPVEDTPEADPFGGDSASSTNPPADETASPEPDSFDSFFQ